ncbi:LysR family transcriptional regulator [Azomonas macrocytogenes]|uniref:DNA-binding transcriptional LysR family regulator n=1 Tax=Azomonas macrocytogenes TaxID=69962 RepID=A0A839T3P7_AZOMA|nr:LysR family transcriptional regulator [Azomonas macrocytogenes]MBB3103106.1 DNA-binding transcriptional LysR family regulator [Azomonas macrocytogenes]
MRGSDHAALRAFVAIVEHGNFARAAANLGMSPSALSQIIRTLEDKLGVRLLNRTTRSVAPSEAGIKLLARLRPALAELDAAVSEIVEAGQEISGTLRINTTRIAAIHYLARLIGPFLNAHPKVSLDIVTDERLVDIVASGFDAGIRLGEKLEKDMVAVRLGGELKMQVVAAPAYLERFGTPVHPRELREHLCLGYRRPSDGSLYRWEFERGKEKLEVAVSGPLVVTEPEMLIEVVRSGAGISYLFDHQVRAPLESGELVQLMPDWTAAFPGFFIYYPSRHQIAPPLRAFLDFVGKDSHHSAR